MRPPKAYSSFLTYEPSKVHTKIGKNTCDAEKLAGDTVADIHSLGSTTEWNGP